MREYNLPILFVDVETTGLDANRDALLEIGSILTDPHGNELDRFESLLYTGVTVESLRKNAPIVVQEMHDKNGLWDALNGSDILSTFGVDQSIAHLISKHVPACERIRIAGNSPRLDLDFIQVNLPQTSTKLHHRFFDLTGIQTFLAMFGGYEPPEKPESNHRAMGDAEACLAQWRFISEWLTAHDAEVEAKALEDAALGIDPADCVDTAPGPYRDGLMQGARDAQIYLRSLARMKRGA